MSPDWRMKNPGHILLGLLLLHLPLTLLASGASTGPVIERYGPVYDYPSAEFKLDPAIRYRSVMDISKSPESSTELNRTIESAARFLNMHVRDGIPLENLELVLVLHGAAGKDSLSDSAYTSRYGSPNPNTELLKALHDSGVRIYLCGQTAGFRGFGAEELNPVINLATSAMSVLTRLQIEGWALLP
jgi:intracellular sulfur oxidation DsrE/DsrF family protein